jgi:hypothetical protein
MRVTPPPPNRDKFLRGRPEDMRTFMIRAPLETHWRPATCAEVDCPHYLGGWDSIIDETDPDLGQAQAHHIRHDSGRRFTEERNAVGLTIFHFEPGQTCFDAATHRTLLGRPELFIVREGDSRGNPRGTPARVHQTPDNWVEEFALHQQQLSDLREKG